MPLAPLLACLVTAAAPTPPRTDLFGDPLPAGAVARLGTVRLRHAGLSDFVCPSNATALTAGYDKVVRLWDLASGKQTRAVALGGVGGPGIAVTLSPDGKTLAAFRDATILLWDAETGKELTRLPHPSGRLAYLYFSPDGTTLAAGDTRNKVILHEWRAGKERVLAPIQARRIVRDSSMHCTFSPDGKWVLAQADSSEPLCAFDFATGRLVHKIPCHAITFAVSPDSKTVAVQSWMNDNGDREFALRFLDLATGKEVKSHPLKGEPHFGSLAFSPDGKQLACGSSEVSRVLDIASGRELYRLTEYPRTMAYTPDGKRLLASSGYGLRVWDAVTGKELHDRTPPLGYSLAAAVSPDGATLAAAGWSDTAVSLWDTSTGRFRGRLPLGGHGRHVRDLSFSPDGRTLTAAQFIGYLQTWDVASAREVRSVQLGGQPKRDSMYCYRLHVARDGRAVSTAERVHHGKDGDNTRLARWDLATGTLLDQVTIPGERSHCAWRSDGKLVADFTDAGLMFFDLERAATRVRAKGVRADRLAWSNDDRFLVGRRSGEGKVTLWEAATGGEAAAVKTGPIDHFALVPGGRFLVTTDARTLRVWDLVTGEERGRRALAADAAVVSALVVLPDGRRAVTALGDGTGLVWDLSFARRRADPGGAADAQALAAWWDDLASKDARRAFAAEWRFADLPPGDALAFLRARLHPAGDLDAKAVSKHIKDLDSDHFATREKATKALESLGLTAAPVMRAAAEKSPSLEVKRRLGSLLDKLAGAEPPPELLRQTRAVFLVEALPGGAGRPLLVELAKGAADAPLTLAAKEALTRLTP